MNTINDVIILSGVVLIAIGILLLPAIWTQIIIFVGICITLVGVTTDILQSRRALSGIPSDFLQKMSSLTAKEDVLKEIQKLLEKFGWKEYQGLEMAADNSVNTALQKGDLQLFIAVSDAEKE